MDEPRTIHLKAAGRAWTKACALAVLGLSLAAGAPGAPGAAEPRSRPAAAAPPPARIEPTRRDVAYGPHERNVLDFWRAESEEPTPLVVFIHGGGFQSFSKERIDQRFLRQFLDAGISVAAINYRYVQIEPLPAASHDSRRALQFLRSKAAEWNIDGERVGAYGGSAGAMISMWLGFHDDMAQPQSAEPVERESTRLTCIATQGGQITFDREWMRHSIPGNMIHKNPAMMRLFGVDSMEDLDRPDVRRTIVELSPITHLTADDPPIYMEYAMAPDSRIPSDPAQVKPWALHHVIFGITLKVRMDALGIESDLRYPGADAVYGSIPEFMKAKLVRQDEAAEDQS